MTLPTTSRPQACITGASAGIGAAFAQQLAQDGYDLLLVARRQEQLDAVANQARAHGAQVAVLAADLTVPDQRRAVEARLAEAPRLSLLVNNAGFAAYQPFATQDPEAIETQLQLHVIALTRLTRAVLPGMVARGTGAIINLSSGLAFSAGLTGPGLPPRVVYAATKAFINSFSELLADELAGTGVQVQAVCPGPVRTEFFAETGMTLDRFPPGTLMEPDAVVQAALAGLQLGERVCIPALTNPAVVAHSREAQHQVLAQLRGATLAPRYTAAGGSTG